MTTYERGLQEYPEVAEFEQQVHPQSEGHWCVCATETMELCNEHAIFL